ncbi:hypothetical protein CENSYa_0522 [Cenarchaeum symbiosum A]|uniref:Uncharacterized protein n=1 Tax=Cenarchaeum symbiosum (strain A) TaxID=414004 RepID=A0RUY8_CENSY|nr:hypothetical protein CENSYa_0522 [Cenarchaeum symbiosum A]
MYMTIPMRNRVYNRIIEGGPATDVELTKALIKAGAPVAEDRFEKILLDLEILGLIKVTWMTKDTRRIEAVPQAGERDEVEEQAREAAEKDYEASFPGAS